jgi:hypothetical protein
MERLVRNVAIGRLYTARSTSSAWSVNPGSGYGQRLLISVGHNKKMEIGPSGIRESH